MQSIKCTVRAGMPNSEGQMTTYKGTQGSCYDDDDATVAVPEPY